MGPQALAQVLRPLSALVPPECKDSLLSGLAEGDDAAVYRLNDSQALIFTVDFFTPVVDDPYDYGAIAAANALSDVYAMGGTPILALNIAGFTPELDPATIAAIVRGGAEKAAEAGCAVVGGHTIMDVEPKYGMAVIGLAHPDRLFLKNGARAGDMLVLTKPLGTGIITTGAKNGVAAPEVLAGAVASMKRMNREACTVFLAHGVRSCTDVTGFSLAGHGLELAEKSGVRLRLFARSLEFLPGARELAAQGSVPGGTGRNRAYFQDRLDFGSSLDEVFRTLVFSPETSGGLLAAVPAAQVSACMLDLARAGVAGRIVGMVESGGDGTEGARIRVEDTAPGSV